MRLSTKDTTPKSEQLVSLSPHHPSTLNHRESLPTTSHQIPYPTSPGPELRWGTAATAGCGVAAQQPNRCSNLESSQTEFPVPPTTNISQDRQPSLSVPPSQVQLLGDSDCESATDAARRANGRHRERLAALAAGEAQTGSSPSRHHPPAGPRRARQPRLEPVPAPRRTRGRGPAVSRALCR